jgi:hypothetical protein
MATSVTHEEAAIPGFHEEKHARRRSFWPFQQISESRNSRCSAALLGALTFAVAAVLAAQAQTSAPHPSFKVLTRRMDVDVDGAPNAYGPPGKRTLDVLINAHYLEHADRKIVGYLLLLISFSVIKCLICQEPIMT